MNDAQTAVTKKPAMNGLFVQNAVETPNLGVSTSELSGRLYINIKLQYQFDWMICFILPTRPFSSFTFIP